MLLCATWAQAATMLYHTCTSWHEIIRSQILIRRTTPLHTRHLRCHTDYQNQPHSQGRIQS